MGDMSGMFDNLYRGLAIGCVVVLLIGVALGVLGFWLFGHFSIHWSWR